MTLMLHTGAKEITFEELRQVELPPPTETHYPIAHSRLVEMLRHSLTFYGHEITEEHHAVTPDGQRYFGLVSLKSTYGDYTDTAILRNSNDRSFPIGVGYGGRVFCCDNLSFHAQHVIRRKHTKSALRDVHGLLAELVEPLALERQRQHFTFDKYKATQLTDQMADHAMMEMYRHHVLNIQRIPEVLIQWERPSHDWGKGSAWHLFNAVTLCLNGRIAERPEVTTSLHRVIDSVCERL